MNPNVPPPIAPGTRPTGTDIDPPLPAFRENPDVAARDEAAGVITQTEQRREARMRKTGRDLARAEQQAAEQHVSGAAWEQVSILGARVVREAEARTAGWAAAVSTMVSAGRRETETRTLLERVENEAAEATGAVPSPPWSGLGLTQWWVLLLGLVVPVFLEIVFSVDPLLVALPNGGVKLATFAAIAIAAVQTLVVELIALFVGARLAGAGRWVARITTAVIGLGLAALVVWAVLAFAGSRQNNVVVAENLLNGGTTTTAGSFGVTGAAPTASTSGSPGSFGGASSGAFANTGAGAFTDTGAGTADTPTPAAAQPLASTVDVGEPSLGFLVPLTLLALTAGMVLSLRYGMAQPWKSADARRARAEAKATEARRRHAATSDEHERSIAVLDAINVGFAQAVHLEIETTRRMLDVLQDEYQHAATAHGRAAGQLPRPQLPDAETLILQCFDPPRPPARRIQAAGSAPGEPPPPAEPPSDDRQEPADVVQTAPDGPADDARGEDDLWAAEAPAPADAAEDPDDRPAGWQWFGEPVDLSELEEPGTAGHIYASRNGRN
jgi:hypothetical protein